MLELFIVFFKLGAFTIGGGIAMLPLLQRELIEKKKWFTEEEFIDAVAVCQSLPGIVAINMATYVGYKRKGTLGSIIATFGVIIPSFLIILALATGLARFGDNRYIAGALAGFRAAALGLVLVSVIQLGSAIFKGSKWNIVGALIAFSLIVFFKIDTGIVVLLFLIYGLIFRGRSYCEKSVQGDTLDEQSNTTSDGGDSK